MNLRGWVDPARYGRTHTGYRTARSLDSFAPHIRLARPAEIYDQVGVGRCVAEACALGVEILALRQGYPPSRPDRTDLYHAGRRAIGTIAEDSGCIGADVLAWLKQAGWRRETREPSPIFDESYTAPPPVLPADAPRLVNTEPLAIDVPTLLWELTCGHPVVAGLRITEQWDRPGEVIGPPEGDTAGGHMVCFDGYQIQGDRVQIRVANSWSASWADGGEAWLDASWVSVLRMGEMHAMRAIRWAA